MILIMLADFFKVIKLLPIGMETNKGKGSEK